MAIVSSIHQIYQFTKFIKLINSSFCHLINLIFLTPACGSFWHITIFTYLVIKNKANSAPALLNLRHGLSLEKAQINPISLILVVNFLPVLGHLFWSMDYKLHMCKEAHISPVINFFCDPFFYDQSKCTNCGG